MKQVYKFDKNGRFTESMIIASDENGKYSIPINATSVPVLQPSYKPVFDKQKGVWFESASKEEIDELTKEAPAVPSDKERIEALESALLEIIMGGF